ncbi:PHP domain-containing protein [Halomarina rubra]|uniref:PHP domain-containing protein n=1 Tax=Halomarina rubra TaxID=2071873 RepID=A0ABD6AVN9_9EURY|nr:PHP domain-containing protein [Halomarina rubra]
MSVYADLHAHTTLSDGKMELEDVPAVASTAGVSVVAITDHDRIHPGLSEPVTTVDGVTLIRGIELRVYVNELDEKIDLLGYAVTETPALMAVIDCIQADRVERGQKIIDSLESEFGVSLGIRGRPGIGRPHIARAVAEHPELDHDYQTVFDKFIGRDCDHYVPRKVISLHPGVKLLRNACAVVALAHPFRYDDPEGALALTSDLDAVERYYPYDRDVDMGVIDRVAAENNLVVTGGTDAHEHELGKAGLSEEQYAVFADAIGLSA